MVAPKGTPRAENHLGLARVIASDYWQRIPRGVELDDLVGEAMLALVRATQEYRSDAVVPFGRFARAVINTHLRRYVWRLWRDLPPLPTCQADESIPAKPEQPYDPEADAEIDATVVKALDALTDLERLVVVRLYGFGGRLPVTQIALARELACCRQRVGGIHQRALAKMRGTISGALHGCATTGPVLPCAALDASLDVLAPHPSRVRPGLHGLPPLRRRLASRATA